jgi:hypothetical protein
VQTLLPKLIETYSMAYAHHDNRVKHLNGTSGCKCYHGLEAPSDSDTRCATHAQQCKGAKKDPGHGHDRATRGCHVIMANQSPQTGTRYIIYCCPSCNGNKNGTPFDVRSNAVMHNLDGKPCKAQECKGKSHPSCSHGLDF